MYALMFLLGSLFTLTVVWAIFRPRHHTRGSRIYREIGHTQAMCVHGYPAGVYCPDCGW